MMQLAERCKKTLCLPICLSEYMCRLTFHTEFGASAVFVDENKKDEEEHTCEARQTNSDGNLGEIKSYVTHRQQSQGMCSHHNPFQIYSDHLKYCKSEINPLDCDYCFLIDYSNLEKS